MDNNNNKTATTDIETVRSEFYTSGLVTYRIIIPIIKHIGLFIIGALSLLIPFVGVIISIAVVIVGLLRLIFDMIMLFSYISEEIRITGSGIEGKAAFFRNFG